MERKIRNAAKALILRDGKMLAIKISDGREEWYILPGGGQNVEELLPEAACREAAEEMGIGAETVKSYLRSVMRKLGAHTRYEAVNAARRIGALP